MREIQPPFVRLYTEYYLRLKYCDCGVNSYILYKLLKKTNERK